MCFFSDWTRPDFINFWIAIGTVATSILTAFILRVAYLAYKKLLSQEAAKMQIKLVSDLVSNLGDNKIRLYGKHIPPRASKTIQNLNIFIYANLAQLSQNDNSPVNTTWDIYMKDLSFIFNYLTNPLLPQNIANAINKMRDLITIEHINEREADYYILSHDLGDIDSFFGFSRFRLSGGYNGWLQACKNIQISIDEWYKSNGIKQINQFALKLDQSQTQ
jgi:hypothetical protein